jgi:predicted TIM-barrel fold metal-dependent hydrolase
MIIDIHTHVGLGRTHTDPRRLLDALLGLADRVGIDRLCILGNVSRFGRHPASRSVRVINNGTLTLMQHRPDRVFGFCYLNPANDPDFVREELDRCVEAGMRGVKLWVAVNARDHRLDPIMAHAGRLRIPVLHHAWYKTVQKGSDESNPSDIADLARRFPRTTIIMAHLIAAGPRGVLDIEPCPNVYADVSGSQPQAGVVEYAVSKIGAGRILFGSDMGARDFSSQLAKIYGARITPRERKLILGGNAARLLRLDGKR